MQIQQTAVQSQRALAVTRQQVANKERERRILQLTMSEVGQTEDSVNVYRGVGKMWPTRISAYCVFSNIREKVYDDSPFGHGERPQKSREGLDGRHQHPGQKGELLRAAFRNLFNQTVPFRSNTWRNNLMTRSRSYAISYASLLPF